MLLQQLRFSHITKSTKRFQKTIFSLYIPSVHANSLAAFEVIFSAPCSFPFLLFPRTKTINYIPRYVYTNIRYLTLILFWMLSSSCFLIFEQFHLYVIISLICFTSISADLLRRLRDNKIFLSSND